MKLQQLALLYYINAENAGASWVEAQAWCEREARAKSETIRKEVLDDLAQYKDQVKPAAGYEAELAEASRRRELRTRDVSGAVGAGVAREGPSAVPMPIEDMLGKPKAKPVQAPFYIPMATSKASSSSKAPASGSGKRAVSLSASEEVSLSKAQAIVAGGTGSRIFPRSPAAPPIHTAVWLHTSMPSGVLHIQAKCFFEDQGCAGE